MMTTRKAVEICREIAAKTGGTDGEAIELCARIAAHHAERNRKNKRRQRDRENAKRLQEDAA